MTSVKSLSEILAEFTPKTASDTDLITRAYSFAEEAHRPQKRYSGDPYFLHVAEVGYSLAKLGMDAQAVAAGLLHDTIEDAGATEEQIREQFGADVLRLVDGVTKLGALKYRGVERHTESLRKLFAATAQDIRVLIIKLMDRLHNVKTLEHVPKHKSRRIALETLEVYAPIADRLGMGVIKTELEDAAFPFAYPEAYAQVRELVKERSSETQKRLEKAEKAIKKELATAGLRTFTTQSRKKGLYSLYRKLERKNWDITQIHDILALRILVPTTSDCYTVLGVVHGGWRPVPGKIKDYIASPKMNGYQSIHTTIYTGDGGTLEIQIRSEAMHREAEFGIASHLSYKEESGYVHARKGSGIGWIRQFIPLLSKPTPATPKEYSNKASASVPHWVKELAEADQSAENSKEYLGNLKADFFNYRVFTFTPQNDVIDLPIDATPIDFAYAIHSDIGNHIAGVKVNGKMATIDTKLKNGDIVEILTKPSSKPSQKWIKIARTNMAKKHIRAALGQQASK